MKKECEPIRFHLWLIDEHLYDCYLMIDVLFKSWLAIKISVLRPLRPFASAEGWEVLSCSWFRWRSVARCFHDFYFYVVDCCFLIVISGWNFCIVPIALFYLCWRLKSTALFLIPLMFCWLMLSWFLFLCCWLFFFIVISD